MTKVNPVKISLLLILLGGTVAGLFTYNQVLSIVGRIFDFRLYWIFIPILFIASLLTARSGLKSLARDLTTTRAFNEIRPAIVLKFFIGGFIGCYVAVSVVGTILLILYLIAKPIFF